MEKSLSSLQNLVRGLTQPEFIAQVIAIAVALAVAFVSAHFARIWYARLRAIKHQPRWQTRIAELVAILAPLVIALAIVAILKSVAGRAGMPATIIDASLQLIGALALVRVGVFLLRMGLGPKSWLIGWETAVTVVLWLLLGFELLGWFDGIERFLNGINLLPGAKFTVWALLKGMVVVTAFGVVTSLIARFAEQRIMRLDGIAISTRIGISKFLFFSLVSLGILLGINAAGVNLSTLTVLTGAVGLGLGFGLQAIASNFVSGFVLLMDKSIKPGDVISFTGTTGTSTENFGWVEELRGRYVVVRDRDGVETLVPNQNLITNSVINWSYSDQRVRLRLPVMISYDDDPELALKVLLEAARNHPRILLEPAPVSRLMAFEDYGMRVEVRFWIRDPMNGVNNVRSDVNRSIWRLFRDNGIRIPVAQRELRILPPHGESKSPLG
ncbi:MAG: mechanosensitive ion channel [Steroidobacteraceae bacterium]